MTILVIVVVMITIAFEVNLGGIAFSSEFSHVG